MGGGIHSSVLIKMDFTCDLDCPAKDETPSCCKACCFSRRPFLKAHPELQDKWDDEDGFWKPEGCVLPRKQRPSVCNEYDCKNGVFVVVKYYDHKNKRWVESASAGVPEKSKDFVIAGVAFQSPEQAREIYEKHGYKD